MDLDTPIERAVRTDARERAGLKRFRIATLRDLFYTLPSRYIDPGEEHLVEEATAGDHVSITGKILKSKTSKGFRKKIALSEATLDDGTGALRLTWFNQPYIAKMFPAGSIVRVRGKVTDGKRGRYIANPEIEHASALAGPLFEGGAKRRGGGLIPAYPERRGTSSRWLYHTIKKLLTKETLRNIVDPIPEEIRKRYKLPGLADALHLVHAPRNAKDAEAARKRFAFEEVFKLQLVAERVRTSYRHYGGFAIEADPSDIEKFLGRFPFEPTNAQRKAIEAILTDFSNGAPMLRLLEGDVGSGKTAVAATAAYAVASARVHGKRADPLQVAYMAPTEILARQHFESFIRYFKHLPINIGLITGSGCQKFPSKVDPEGATDISRTQFLRWVADGSISIVVGTHALVQKSVSFKRLALVIIDEQHRFGVTQRKRLGEKRNGHDGVPHLLSMTATPIPRTLALTVYGNLDLTLLDEMPAGRKAVLTEIIPNGNRGAMYANMRRELEEGRQAYVICPRINEPDPEKELAIVATSVKEEAARLKKEIFPERTIAILHSKMKDAEKEETLSRFLEGKTDILVATSMVEVGINVPNATVIAIEGAERFGLAQLHQLRGRVLRSSHQAYCYLVSDSLTGKSGERLKAAVEAKNGFELAELDLNLRGAGELGGGKQWGVSDIGMEAIKNLKMVEAARTEARSLVARDPELSSIPLLRRELEKEATPVHLE